MTSSSFVKVATTRLKLSSHIEELDVQEKSVDDFTAKYPNITVVSAKLDSIHSKLWDIFFVLLVII